MKKGVVWILAFALVLVLFYPEIKSAIRPDFKIYYNGKLIKRVSINLGKKDVVLRVQKNGILIIKAKTYDPDKVDFDITEPRESCKWQRNGYGSASTSKFCNEFHRYRLIEKGEYTFTLIKEQEHRVYNKITEMTKLETTEVKRKLVFKVE